MKKENNTTIISIAHRLTTLKNRVLTPNFKPLGAFFFFLQI